MFGWFPIRRAVTVLVSGFLALTLAQAETTKKPSNGTGSKATSTKKKKHAKSRKKSSRGRGQKAIDSERIQKIQEALIREHYLEGEPSGKWDDETQAALRRFQADNGWQNKTVPDSRALIKLGLGPNQEHLLNPETAMTATSANSKASVKPATADPPAPTPIPPSTSAAPQQ